MYEWVLILVFWDNAGGLAIDFTTREACMTTQKNLNLNDYDDRIKISYCAFRGKKLDGKVEK